MVHAQAHGERLLTVAEAAAYLGLAKLTIYDWVSQRKIRHVKVGRLTRFKQQDLDSWVAAHTIMPIPHASNS